MRWPGLSEIRDMSELQLGSTGLDCNKKPVFYRNDKTSYRIQMFKFYGWGEWLGLRVGEWFRYRAKGSGIGYRVLDTGDWD